MAARTLQELVEAAAIVHPDRVAVTYDGGTASKRPESLRYQDLIELSGELSQTLRLDCSAVDGVIGLYCTDDLLIPVWILGILQTPAAYVPLDPEAPGLLCARVMNQCGLQYCAVKTDLLQQFQTSVAEHLTTEVHMAMPKFKLVIVRLRGLQVNRGQGGAEQSGAQRAGGADCVHRQADMAYVLHTSGTTGPAKTVRVPHKCILPNIIHLRSLFEMEAEDVVFLASPLTFDPSVVDLFLALSSGAQVLIIPSVIKKMPGRLARLLFEDHKTTVLQVTPTLLVRFGHHVLKKEVLSAASSLRVLALGGEACPSPALLRAWKQQDNKTSIYNIYGITEVSCWACCYKIPESTLQTDDQTASWIPLGPPLMGTRVEVRDDDGHVVTEGEGQVFIGGEERVCLLDHEDTLVPGTMRATGDWVDVRDAQLRFLGRRDRLIKRHGKRVNLDSVQQMISGLPQVEASFVLLHQRSRLLAFVVMSSLADQAQQREDRTGLPRTPTEATGSVDGDLSGLVLRQLSLLLPSYSVPDTLVIVPALCQTPHGKVDTEALLSIYHRQRRSLTEGPCDLSGLRQTLQRLWQDSLGLPADQAVDEDANFLLSGGDSLKALHLCEDVIAAAGASSPELLEVLLDRSFADVLHHVACVITAAPMENGRRTPPKGNKRRAGDTAAVPSTKRECNLLSAADRADEAHAVKVVRRAGEVTDLKSGGGGSARGADAVFPSQASDSGEKPSNFSLALRQSWSSDTGRCVDASPVLLVHGGATAFIGSHSHRFQALELTSGSCLWERVLGGRIESSAAVSLCGSLVVVGCYDGCVYFLCATSGKTRWTFQTGDAVKSCPAVDPLTGQVIVGSHDGHVYALNPEKRQCVWKRHCGGGAVFSSPSFHPSLRQLYVASLGGRLLCLHPDSGEVLWTQSIGVPIFSSPNASCGLVLVGSVDGNISCLSSSGEVLWQFLTEGPVFSSPCVTPDGRSVLCGSHDGRLYCLNVADGSPAWTFQTTAKVYSSPCTFNTSGAGLLVATASTDGTLWILDGGDGRALASATLAGELFSSPVVWGRSLVIGCRNDYVYCLELTDEGKMKNAEG